MDHALINWHRYIDYWFDMYVYPYVSITNHDVLSLIMINQPNAASGSIAAGCAALSSVYPMTAGESSQESSHDTV
jgi:hypothetical protein